MKVVIAIDSFKGSMSSLQAGNAAARGVKCVYEDAEIVVKSLADGGEGTTQALVDSLNGEWTEVYVTGPLGEKVMAHYAIATDCPTGKKTAIMEMAEAAGITLVSEKNRNPLYTTTYGVGEMILDAIDKGCRNFIVGIGGSATNDGGAGMLQALGFSLLDENGCDIPFGAQGLSKLVTIKDDNVNNILKECSFEIACDVNNPLLGENGCSEVFTPQKGATPDMVRNMEDYISNYAKLVQNYAGDNTLSNYPGAGAAGGLGFAFISFLHTRLVSGVELIIEKAGLEEEIKTADLVITGEGKLDAQTAMGKTPVGIAKLAKKYGKRVIAFAGCIGEGASDCLEAGIDNYYSISEHCQSLEEAMDIGNAEKNMEEKVKCAFDKTS